MISLFKLFLRLLPALGGLAFCLPGVLAQAYYPRFDFKPGDTVVAYQNKVFVYKKPKVFSDTMGILSLGQPAVIQRKTAVSSDIGGRREFWYKVSFGKQYLQEGYIFGEVLATAQAVTPDSIRFLFHFTLPDPTVQHELIEVKVIGPRAALPITSSSLELSVDDTIMAHVYGNRGYKGYKNIIVFTIQNKTCPINAREYAFMWDGIRAKALPTFSPAGDRQASCYGFTFVFPGDPDGEPGFIKIKIKNGAGAPEWKRLREKYGMFLPVKE